MTIAIKHSPDLMRHLEEFVVDGTTVAALLFEGDRLAYPGRKLVEHELGYREPYTLRHEARIIEGLSRRTQASIRALACNVQFVEVLDPTLELLWCAHAAWAANGISLDRLVAALVAIECINEREATCLSDRESGRTGGTTDPDLLRAATNVISTLEAEGFPPSSDSLEELFDGAPPACVGLGMVDIDWRIKR